MVSPSVFLRESLDYCGKPGADFIRELEDSRRPALVSHPTFRRVDWRSASEPWPGEAPTPRGDTKVEDARWRSELFVWSQAAWRGMLAPQLAAIAPWRPVSRDGRECHAFTLGYVRGAIWELLENARLGENLSMQAFIGIAATADVFGLEWVDDIEDAIDDLKGSGLPPVSMLAFQDGARLGIEDMECYLEGTRLEPRHLAQWFAIADCAATKSGERPYPSSEALDRTATGCEGPTLAARDGECTGGME